MNFKSAVKDLDLWRALVISLALHAWLLSQKPPQPAAARAVQPLAATLRLAAEVAGEPGKLAPESAPRLSPAAISPTSHAGNAAAVAPVPAAADAPPLPKAPMARFAGAAASGVSASEGKAVASVGPDAEGVRQYRVSLAAAARRFKRYPALALERGWRGSVRIELAIAAGGVPQPPRLMISSGHELLDEAALAMIGRAAEETLVPSSLRGRAFVVSLPVVFDLDEE